MPDRKKVLLVLRPAVGGMRAHVLNLVRYLPEQEFVFEAAGPPHDPLLEELDCLGIPTHPLQIGASVRPREDLAAIRGLRRILRGGGFSLVHAHGFKASLPGRVAATLCGVPVVYTVHNFVSSVGGRRATRLVYLGIEKLLAPFTQHYITVSQALATDLSREVGVPTRRMTVILNGIDVERFRGLPPYPASGAALAAAPTGSGDSGEERVILTVARLVREKGLDVLLQAARLFLDGGRRARFLIAGEGPLEGDLKALAKSLALSQQVVFLGHQQDILPLYARAHLVAFPSIAEGLSISLIEAMAAGRPVVASRTGGMVELVHDDVTGLLVQPGSAVELAAAFNRFWDEPGLAARLAASAREAARGLSVQAMADRTAAVYRDIIHV